MQLKISRRGTSLRFDVRVQPRASRTEVVGLHGEALRVRLAAPPVDGAANEALIDALSRWLHVPPRDIRIVAGHGSRNKVVEIAGLQPAALGALLHDADRGKGDGGP